MTTPIQNLGGAFRAFAAGHPGLPFEDVCQQFAARAEVWAFVDRQGWGRALLNLYRFEARNDPGAIMHGCPLESSPAMADFYFDRHGHLYHHGDTVACQTCVHQLACAVAGGHDTDLCYEAVGEPA